MSEPDWTNVESVRAWLEQRYLVANKDTGSPFFQYLKDELGKGNKIRGRETHLSKDEFLRWVWDTNMDANGPRGFHYSGGMRTPYYPEYVDELSQSESQSPVQSDDMPRHETSTPSNGHAFDHKSSKPLRNRARTKSRKKKLPSKNKSAKKKAPTALGDEESKTESRSKAPPGLGIPKATSTTKDLKKIETEARERQKARIGALRPRDKCKRGKTEFFHPDKSRREQKSS